MKILKLSIFALICALIFTQCVDREFEIPDLNGVSPELPADAVVVSIRSLLDNQTLGTSKALPAGSYIKGIVVGDDKTGNIYKTMIIQDETAGIAIIIDETDLFNTYYVGKEVYVKLDNLYLGDYNNNPQIGMSPDNDGVTRIPAALITDIFLEGTFNNQLDPVVLTLGQLSRQHLNMLVQFDNVEFAAFELNKTFATAIPEEDIFQSENRIVNNCEGVVDLTVRSSGFSSFANTVIPSGNGTLYGILTIFDDTYQLTIRDLADVQFFGERCDGGSGTGGGPDQEIIVLGTGGSVDGALVEDFQSGSSNSDVVIDGWLNIVTQGERFWRYKEFDGNVFIQATAFTDENAVMESYLVTPELNFDNVSNMSFKSATAFYSHGGLDVLYSSNFDGDPNTATWEAINCNLAGSGQDNYDWVESGNIDLTVYSGKGHIAFRYTGSGPNGDTNTMILDDIEIE